MTLNDIENNGPPHTNATDANNTPLTRSNDWIQWTSSNFRHHVPWHALFYTINYSFNAVTT